MKKGQIASYIEWTLKLIPVFIIAVFIFVIASKQINAPLETHPLEAKLTMNALKYHCLILEKERPQLGVIDIEKFTEDKIKKCYSKNELGYTLTLLNKEKEELKKIKNFPSLNHERILPVCETIPEYECATTEEFILIYNKGTLEPSFLKLEVVNRVA